MRKVAFVKLSELEAVANDIRQDIITMVAEAGSGHPGGSLSIADIMAALYFGGFLKHDPSNPQDETRDRFILSKGHAAPALYATLAQAGYFPHEEIKTLRKLGSRLQGHPDSKKLPGVEVSTGSLGQGLSIATGLALGLRLEGSSSRVVTILGDGECQEGQVWEALMFAAQQKLSNLIALVDHNTLQIDGSLSDICDVSCLADKLRAFNWEVYEFNGNDMQEVVETLTHAFKDTHAAPVALVAHTTKGCGVSFMEGLASWHGKAPSADQRDEALSELASKKEALCG